MDNVIWIILASAVFIALAGILLAIGGSELTNLDSEAENISDYTRWTDYSKDHLKPDSVDLNAFSNFSEKSKENPVI